MIDFDDEIKKFQPVLEVEDAEEAIYGIEAPDLSELVGKIVSKIDEQNGETR